MLLLSDRLLSSIHTLGLQLILIYLISIYPLITLFIYIFSCLMGTALVLNVIIWSIKYCVTEQDFNL